MFKKYETFVLAFDMLCVRILFEILVEPWKCVLKMGQKAQWRHERTWIWIGGAHTQGARSPGWLNFVWCHVIFV